MATAKDWDPNLYLKFRNERTQPSIDLVNRINLDHAPQRIIDIGCGPGNSSQVLLQRWPQGRLTGLDSSVAMIEKARHDYPAQEWVQADAATFTSAEKFDLVFSNATIQWIPDHTALLKRFCGLLTENGALAFQLPLFREMPIGQSLHALARQERWQEKTRGVAELFTCHDHRFYYDLLVQHLAVVEMWETNYFHALGSHQAILEWIRSTGLKPYLERIADESEKREFEQSVLERIIIDYPAQADGKVLFPFKRLFVVGYKLETF
jgi:trans-aconitate 2-methyltransferase